MNDLIKKKGKMWFATIFVLILAHQVSGVIHRLNASEYAKLPDVNGLESFSHCLLEPGDVYCYVDATLVADESNDLYYVLQEYSAYTKTHFNHTLIHRGVCLTRSCREHLRNSADVGSAIEACLNETIYKSHGLQTRVLEDKMLCTEYGEQIVPDVADWAVVVLLAMLLALNIAGTLYHVCFYKGSSSTGSRLLLSFSIPRNWGRLKGFERTENKRTSRLKSLHGYRLLTTLAVIVAHSPLSAVFATKNPEFMENIFNNSVFAFTHNSSVCVETFIVISGFLTAYSILLQGEKGLGFTTLLKCILLKWLRLTPVYAVVLAFVATWQRYLGSGPLFKTLVEAESLQCRRYWYYNLLYVNNFVDNIDCMVPTWYLGVEMQLSILGLAVFCLATSAKTRKACTSIVFVMGLLAPAFYVLHDGVDAIPILGPEKVRHFLVRDPTFNLIHKRGHSRMACYAIGMALAMLVHRLQETNFSIAKYKKYRPLYWALFPLIVAVITSGKIMYTEDLEVPVVLKAIYASAYKMAFGLFIAAMIAGNIFRLEGLYRGIVEWSVFPRLARLSYCVFLLHFSIIRIYFGNFATLIQNFLLQIITEAGGFILVSFVLAVPLWLLVEAPFAEMIKVWAYPPKGSDLGKKLEKTQGCEDNKEKEKSK